jgi:DNA-binding transcriptional MerR regulator
VSESTAGPDSAVRPADPVVDSGDGGGGFVIEELSRRTGITVRSLRSYQSRKLLPPPDVRGRTGYYDQRHVDRIQLIQDLQSEGFKLHSIARMLDEGGRSDSDLLRFTRSVRTMFGDTEGAIVDLAELAERFDVGDDLGDAAALLERAVRLGLLRQVDDEHFEELAPRLLRAGEHAVETLGLTAHEALDVVAQLRKHAEGVARLYLDLFLSRVWTPFADAGQPQEQWPQVQASLDEVRQLATDALVGAFEVVMGERVGEAFGRELARTGRRRSR